MNIIKPMVFLVLPVVFILGLWWGTRQKEVELKELRYTMENPIQVLAPKGFFSKKHKEEILKNLKVQLQVFEYSGTQNLFRHSNGSYQLVILPSPLLDQWTEMNPAKYRQIPSSYHSLVSQDFVEGPTRKAGTITLPLFWKVESPEPGSHIVESINLLISKDPDVKTQQEELLSWMLEPQRSLQWAKAQKMSSCVVAVNSLEVEEGLKPQSLRKLPLSEVAFKKLKEESLASSPIEE